MTAYSESCCERSFKFVLCLAPKIERKCLRDLLNTKTRVSSINKSHSSEAFVAFLGDFDLQYILWVGGGLSWSTSGIHTLSIK